MELVYATTNESKLNSMRRMLDGLNLKIIGLKELCIVLPQIEESGNDPLENAKIKAISYFNLIKMPLFSCDSGLHIEGLSDDLQPGVHVRNVNGKYLSDEEMIEYYAGIARSLGGVATAQYRNAICLALSENDIATHMGDDISFVKFYLSDKPHIRREKGFPLDSLSIHIEKGKYYYDLENYEELSLQVAQAFKRFFAQSLKKIREC